LVKKLNFRKSKGQISKPQLKNDKRKFRVEKTFEWETAAADEKKR
jgi:hypothetical protein